jgi:hypothetical protein
VLLSQPPGQRGSLLTFSGRPLARVPSWSGDSADWKNLLKKMRVACDRRRSNVDNLARRSGGNAWGNLMMRRGRCE